MHWLSCEGVSTLHERSFTAFLRVGADGRRCSRVPAIGPCCSVTSPMSKEVRDNQLVGYGLVAGLRGTGDRQQTFFTVQTLANAMLRMGVQINPAQVVVKNVAAVFVTATLPSFASPGMKIDLTVSSVGDAKSLEGGVLLLTALRGPDGRTYAEAQGPLILGGYSEGIAGNIRQVNLPTTARVPNGAIVERGVSVDLSNCVQSL